MAIQDGMNRTFGWQSQLRVVSVDAVSQFRSAPGWELFFEIYDQLLDLEGQPVGLPKRSS